MDYKYLKKYSKKSIRSASLIRCHTISKPPTSIDPLIIIANKPILSKIYC